MNGRHTVYFYNPETNVNNFASLKREFDSYLANKGLFYFQPFRDKEVFERIGLKNSDGLYLMSSWHYQTMSQQQKNDLTPILIASYKGKSTYLKIISTSIKIKNVDSLREIRLASAGSVEYTRDMLRRVLGQQNKSIVDSIKILSVPKDIDALMSVSFGMAQAALTADRSLSKLKFINAKQHARLHIIAKSNDILMPILVKPSQHNSWADRLVSIFLDMGNNLDGRRKLMIIGQDGWKSIDDHSLRMLSQ